MPLRQDIGLLRAPAFTKLINLCLFDPEQFKDEATNLINLTRNRGRSGFDNIEWFNGGLFANARPAVSSTAICLPSARSPATPRNGPASSGASSAPSSLCGARRKR